jgi:glycerol kinase
MMPNFIAAIDQGTTSTRFIVFDQSGNIVEVDHERAQTDLSRAGIWWSMTRE